MGKGLFCYSEWQILKPLLATIALGVEAEVKGDNEGL